MRVKKKKTVTAFSGPPAFEPDWLKVQGDAGVIISDAGRDHLGNVMRSYLVAVAAEKAAVSLDSVAAEASRIQKAARTLWLALQQPIDDSRPHFGALSAIDSELAGMTMIEGAEVASSDEMLSRLTAFLFASNSALTKLKAEKKSRVRSHFGGHNTAWISFVSEADAWACEHGVKTTWSHEASNPPPYLLLIDALMQQIPVDWRRGYNSLPALGQQVREARKNQ